MNMKHALASALLLALPLLVLAQQDNDANTPKTFGAYQVQQSIEFGGRIAEINGNEATYDTFTNLHSGPRLLGQTLTMTTAPDSGGWFDSLYEESFGFGGDPQNLARLRVKKQKIYEFVGLYRRDKNVWDYNLFANPATFNNPGTVITNSAGQLSPFLSNSPHEQITTRNIGDFNLTLFPQSVISIRLGFSRNNNEGLIQSSLHESNEFDIASQSRFRGDRYQVGIDLKLLPRTTFSFDQFYEHDHLNYNWIDNPFSGFSVVGTGTPVDPGIAFQTNPNMVTSGCVTAGVLGYQNGGRVIPTCNNGTFFYNRFNFVRTGIPTSQLSVQSNYFHKLDITADVLYSSATSDLHNYSDVWSGIGTHAGVRIYQITGPAQARRITNNADLGLTYRLTHSWSVSDKFRYLNWRSPGTFDPTEFNCYPNASPANVTTGIGTPCALGALIAAVPGPGISGTVPASIVNAVSPPPANNPTNPFASLSPFIQSLGERSFFNTAQVRWEPSRRIGAFVGFRYGRRELNELDGEGVVTNVPLAPPTNNFTTLANATNAVFVPATLEPDETFRIRLNEYTGLLGVNLRPTDAWRVNADTELLYSDNAFTNITPRHQQKVRVNTNYRVRNWASVFGSLNFVHTQNDWANDINGATAAGTPLIGTNLFPAGYIPAYGHKDHYRYVTVGADLHPKRFTFDFGYTYLNQSINSASCVPMVAGLVPTTSTGAASPLAAPGLCPTIIFTEADTPVAAGEPTITGGLPLVLRYHENTHSFYTNLEFQPVKHFTILLGYELTSDSGSNLWSRGDNGQTLFFAVDQFRNIVTPGSASAVTVLPGPNPLVPLGTQAFNWHKPYAGLEIPLSRGLAFKGIWNYYGYNEKTAFEGPALVPRDFHTNVGTLSLKYSFGGAGTGF